MDRVAEIIEHEKLADDASAEAEEHRWAAARLITEELATGKSQRQLAGEIGKSQPHVFRYARAWGRYGNVSDAERPSFAKACEEANPQGKSSVRAKANQGWEPGSSRGAGHRRQDQAEPEDTEEEADAGPREHEGAALWVRTADEALDMLLLHGPARSLLSNEDRMKLRMIPDKVRRILERFDSSQEKGRRVS